MGTPAAFGEASSFGRPQRTPRASRIPVILVTGYLGAGKTTVIRQLLATEEGRGSAVVVNEFAEFGVDDKLIASQGATTALLRNGCVCCTVRSDLDTTLRGLAVDRATGAIPGFVRVIVEASGVADPGPLLHTLLSDRALGSHYYLQSVVTVVDAATGRASLHRSGEARRQVAVADRIVITKADIAGTAGRDATCLLVRSLAPGARLADALDGRVAPSFLLSDSGMPQRSRFIADAPSNHAADLTSFTLTFDMPFQWPTLSALLGFLGGLRGPDILRVKGIVEVEGAAGPVVLNAVHHILHQPVVLEAWPDGDRLSRIVFITQGIAREGVAALFAAVRTLGLP